MEFIGGSISFQLIDIFNIIEDEKLNEEQKEKKIEDYQKSLTEEGTGILIDPDRNDGQNKKSDYYVFGNVDTMSYEDLVRTKKYVDENLDSFTCEAEMKMTALIAGYNKETKEIIYNFDMADEIYDYAKRHDKVMRGHTLVWDRHVPREVLDEYIEAHYNGNMEEDKINNPENFKKERKEQTKFFLAEYMKAVGEKYPDCYCWDVLNEIVPKLEIDDPENKDCPKQEERDDGLKHSKWFEYLGEEFYIEVLKIARDNLPKGTKLFYNECGEQHLEKREAIIHVIEKIKAYEKRTGKKLLDGIGLQSHYDISVTEQEIEDVFHDFSETGKEIQVTEMDVAPGLDKNGKPIPYSLENMPVYAKTWNKVFECVQKYNIEAFTGWGINDDLCWFPDAGFTMVSKDGSIKPFAKEFFDNRRPEKQLTLQEIGRGTAYKFLENPQNGRSAFGLVEDGVKTQEQAGEGKV